MMVALPRSMRRRRLLPIAGFLAIACTHTVDYTVADDDAAMAAIARTYVETGGGGSLVLVEDTQAEPPLDTNDCQVANVVAGGGRGVDHDQTVGGIGCGGCPFANQAFVQGTLTGAGLTSVAVSGIVVLGVTDENDPYGFPYDVVLECTDPAAPCYVSGTLDDSGALHLDVGVGSQASVHLELVAP